MVGADRQREEHRFFEEFEEEQAYRVSLRKQSIAARARDLFNQALGPEF